jgi:hypothetical protein
MINSKLDIEINRTQEELEVLCRLKRKTQEKLKKLEVKKKEGRNNV